MLRKVKSKRALRDVIEKITLNPVTAIPLMFGVLYLLYLFVGVFGAGYLVDFIENVIFGQYLVPRMKDVITAVIPFGLIRDMLVGEYGILTMALTLSHIL